MQDDAGTDGRWLTYDELATLRGIKRIGAVRLVQRYKWRRQAGNDGKARILVPHALTAPVRVTDAGTSVRHRDTGSDARNLLPAALAALEGALTQARETAAEADARAKAALALADRLSAQLADAGTRAEQAEARAETMRGERDQARADHQKAMAANRKWEAADTLPGRRGGRLRRAWDGWRGR